MKNAAPRPGHGPLWCVSPSQLRNPRPRLARSVLLLHIIIPGPVDPRLFLRGKLRLFRDVRLRFAAMKLRRIYRRLSAAARARLRLRSRRGVFASGGSTPAASSARRFLTAL